MTIIPFPDRMVYVVLGIDEHGHDQVLSVFYTYADAKSYCSSTMKDNIYYDLWIEKHPIL
jgi:hypothetical protein